MSKLIVVVGITGVQGSSVANKFLALPSWRVRGITRNPTSEASLALAAKGIELIKADLNDKESLVPAFEGANVIFSNTDFFALLFGALGSEDPAGRDAIEVAYENEVAQGNNISEVAATPVVMKTLERFVLSSLSDASRWSGGKCKTVYHFDSKAEMLRAIRTRFQSLAAITSTLQIGHYANNWKGFGPMGPQKQADGSFLLQRPFSGDAPLPWIDTSRDTGAFVKALVDLPAGKDLLGVSQSMTSREWIELWGRVMGVKVSFKQVSADEFFEGVPPPMKIELQDAFEYIEEFGYTGGDPDVLLPEKADVKIEVTSMEEYIKGEDWSSIL